MIEVLEEPTYVLSVERLMVEPSQQGGSQVLSAPTDVQGEQQVDKEEVSLKERATKDQES